MKKNITNLADWAINKIEAEYRDDVCLLLGHETLKFERENSTTSFSYYIPATNRANGLSRTFIIDGIGYDLFPISWERIERMADVKDYNTTCLGDASILWAKSEEDKQRFVSLQARLRANLKNPQYMLERANKWFDLLKEVQKYAAGETLYFPKDRERKKWGETTGSRVFFKERNVIIRQKYLNKMSIEHLADEYCLSVETIRKIVFKQE